MQWAADFYFMQCAIREAKRAGEQGEVPIGAVIVREGQLLSKGANEREGKQLASQHAEMIAIEAANLKIGSWRLEDCTLYVTLEPCMMCSGGIIQSRIPRVVYGASDPKGGTVRTLYQLLEDQRFNHTVEVTSGVLETTCRMLLTSFFKQLRAQKKRLKNE